eukprot:5269833-Amphidinium_carterae.1
MVCFEHPLNGRMLGKPASPMLATAPRSTFAWTKSSKYQRLGPKQTSQKEGPARELTTYTAVSPLEKRDLSRGDAKSCP